MVLSLKLKQIAIFAKAYIEADLLDRAWGLEADSRLSCQVKIVDEDMEIEIPKYTLNHASENH